MHADACAHTNDCTHRHLTLELKIVSCVTYTGTGNNVTLMRICFDQKNYIVTKSQYFRKKLFDLDALILVHISNTQRKILALICDQIHMSLLAQ